MIVSFQDGLFLGDFIRSFSGVHRFSGNLPNSGIFGSLKKPSKELNAACQSAKMELATLDLFAQVTQTSQTYLAKQAKRLI